METFSKHQEILIFLFFTESNKKKLQRLKIKILIYGKI